MCRELFWLQRQDPLKNLYFSSQVQEASPANKKSFAIQEGRKKW